VTALRRGPDHPGPPVRWTAGPALRLHAVMAVGVAAASFATWFEWTRALSGHDVAWVYTFEWPLLAAFGIYLWWRLLHADRQDPDAAPTREPATVGEDTAEPDAGLADWQAYLARLHAVDPPGRAPHERS